jgi:tripartite-type tricarboxylate transporter receptor subunit TctC
MFEDWFVLGSLAYLSHLRSVGCCDDSPNRHATKNFHATTHPIIEGYDPPPSWAPWRCVTVLNCSLWPEVALSWVCDDKSLISLTGTTPGKINMGSSGKGTSQHLSGELFKMMTGVDLVHVPYRGGSQVLTDLLSGHVQVSFEALPPSLEFIKSGKLRALAVTTATRSEVLADLPTVGDFVPDYEASGWNGVCAPKNTAIEIIEQLNKQINAGLADPKMKAKLAALGGMVLAGSRADFGKLIADETEKWGKVIRAANIKPE